MPKYVLQIAEVKLNRISLRRRNSRVIPIHSGYLTMKRVTVSLTFLTKRNNIFLHWTLLTSYKKRWLTSLFFKMAKAAP